MRGGELLLIEDYLPAHILLSTVVARAPHSCSACSNVLLVVLSKEVEEPATDGEIRLRRRSRRKLRPRDRRCGWLRWSASPEGCEPAGERPGDLRDNARGHVGDAVEGVIAEGV